MGPLWFLLGGIVLIIVGLLLVLAALGGVAAAFEEDIETQNIGLLFLVGAVAVALGLLCLLIWLIAFAVAVALVETNRRLAHVNSLMEELRNDAGHQPHGADAAPRVDWRTGEPI